MAIPHERTALVPEGGLSVFLGVRSGPQSGRTLIKERSFAQNAIQRRVHAAVLQLRQRSYVQIDGNTPNPEMGALRAFRAMRDRDTQVCVRCIRGHARPVPKNRQDNWARLEALDQLLWIRDIGQHFPSPIVTFATSEPSFQAPVSRTCSLHTPSRLTPPCPLLIPEGDRGKLQQALSSVPSVLRDSPLRKTQVSARTYLRRSPEAVGTAAC